MSVGDVTEDGACDLIVGAPGSDALVTDGGAAYLYLGLPNSFIGPVWTVYGTEASGKFGSSLCITGDLNGDGFGDVFVGSPYAGNVGQIRAYYGGCGGLVEYISGQIRLPRQFRADGITSFSLLGASDQATSLIMGADARSAMGRDRVQAQVQIAPVGTTFAGPAIAGGTFDTGVPVVGPGSAVYLTVAASGLAPQSPYHWRMRFKSRSPYFPHTPWNSPPGNGRQETDARTGADQTSVAGGGTIASSLRFSRVGPNPSRDRTTLDFFLPAAAPARLALYDVAGRRVRTLLDRDVAAGPRSVEWDLRDGGGTRVPAGIYLARLEQGDRTAVAKLAVRR